MDFQKLLNTLLPIIGQAGVDLLTEKFQDLAADQDKPWAKVALMLLADAVETHGMRGIDLARKAIDDLLDNKVPEIDWASPRTASDFVAKLQNAEAEDKSAVRDFFTKIGEVLGPLLTALIKGLISN